MYASPTRHTPPLQLMRVDRLLDWYTFTDAYDFGASRPRRSAGRRHERQTLPLSFKGTMTSGDMESEKKSRSKDISIMATTGLIIFTKMPRTGKLHGFPCFISFGSSALFEEFH